MKYVINANLCVECGVCQGRCSVNAPQHAERTYIINDACLGCGACAAECPTEAISPQK